ncbi:cephalosporin hydroxylase family protein [Candidatus Pelagibacter sp.]|nr:cephalosporin hydroxylase family protein [Candidatus Pelagibacter sp.]
MPIDKKIIINKEHIFYKNQKFHIGSSKGFKLLSDLWLRSGWDTKHVYSFSWLGRPIIQLPEDIIRLQEVIFKLQPNLIIETGVAHGGGLVFYANVMSSYCKPKVIGVDIEIRKHNFKKIKRHKYSKYISLIEGSSIDPKVIKKIDKMISKKDKVLIILDSNHTKSHVLSELKIYSKYVSKGSYIIACDGIMKYLKNAPRTKKDWPQNNPVNAIKEFLRFNKTFKLEDPKFEFNESHLSEKHKITYWPMAYLKRYK